MCGIAGIIMEKGLTASREAVTGMTRALVHRGPDEEGYFIEKEAALGVRRLSIIDLVSGSQPQASHDGRFHIVFNGEIYNYREIRTQLAENGYSFQTHSDTEVILALYQMMGERGLDLLNGMFCFAVWDAAQKKLFLARDRLGVKPLYYSLLKDGTFIFASEIKALLRYPGFSPSLDPKAIDTLMTFGFQLCPGTFFKEIRSVLPGHFIWVTTEKIEQRKYWDLDFHQPKLAGSSADVAEEFHVLLKQSVERRLVSDVPVAAYLSGGIDSSSVVGLYASLKGKINTFSIGFTEEQYNELTHSRLVSDRFSTHHTEFLCAPTSDDFHQLILSLEEPMVTLLHLPLYLLSREVRKAGYKVVLSGDGADEFLGGYAYFGLLKLLHFINRYPDSDFRKKLTLRFNPSLTTEQSRTSFYELMINQLKSTSMICPNVPYGFYVFQNKESLFSPSFHEKLSFDREVDLFFDPQVLAGYEPMDQAFYIESKFRLLNLTLPLSDKMSMAHSVENRSPFLDYTLAEFCSRIPSYMKISGLKEKFILKKAMKSFLPPSIIERKKQPLLAPPSWFLSLIGEELEHYLSEETISEKGYFNPSYLRFRIDQWKQNKNEHASFILMIYFIHLWDDLFLKGKS
ncbi:MAG: asparagine synthase (glutamine-hydrolyzing) [Candidatus Aureabacteria bacterium]|nr:asparagine synthase (glutamine-hydrolyzing) [Candidatus Auribacterota bacterium]